MSRIRRKDNPYISYNSQITERHKQTSSHWQHMTADYYSYY